MLGALSTIFGSKDAIKGVFEFVDDAWETDAEAREGKTRNKIDMLKAYAPFKVAQRYIAFMFVGTYLVSFVLCLGITLWQTPTINAIVQLLGVFKIPYIVLMIAGFYFAGGFLESAGVAKAAIAKPDK